MRCRGRSEILAALALCAVWTFVALGGTGRLEAQTAGGKVVLFTPDEAERFRLAEGEPLPGMLRSVSNGPRVVIDAPPVTKSASPPSLEMTTPGSMSIRFEENGAPVDMSTLEVSAKKAFFRKSLTDLLRPYVQGTSLQVKDVEVPEGNFLIEIFVADSQGGETVANYRLQVTGK